MLFISPNKMYLSESQNVFVQTATCIFPNCKIYFSKLLNVFVSSVIKIGGKSAGGLQMLFVSP